MPDTAADNLPQTAPADPPEDTNPDGKHGACVAEAWDLLAQGVYTWRAIARGVNAKTGCSHDHKWAQRAIRTHSQLVAEAMNDPAIDHRAKYIQGLHADLAAFAVIANAGAKDSDRVAARRSMVDIREKIAAACGVVTQRRGEEVSGANGGPLQVVIADYAASEPDHADGNS